MFTSLRKSGQKFFTRLILFLLAAMFVLWGIGDVFRTMGGGPGYVAKVGNTEISLREFNYSKRPGMNPMMVLNNLVLKTLVRKEATDMGLVVSDRDVIEYIRKIPEL